jgi:hypothetical protein
MMVGLLYIDSLMLSGRFDWDILLKAKNGGAAGESKAAPPGDEAPAAAGEALPPPAEHGGEEPVFSPLVAL